MGEFPFTGGLLYHFRILLSGRFIPNFFNLKSSFEGEIDNFSAAPPGPDFFQLDSSNARRIWLLSISWRVGKVGLGIDLSFVGFDAEL